MSPHIYRFRNVWSVHAPAGVVFKTLVDVDSYPSWWRDVRAVLRADEDSGYVRCRSVLPYALDLRMVRGEEDPVSGQLRVDISGDLEGFCGALVEDHGARTVVRIGQEVVLNKQSIRRVERVLRPVLRANHAAMMRRGERGLRAHLAGTLG